MCGDEQFQSGDDVKEGDIEEDGGEIHNQTNDEAQQTLVIG